jgi:outer membrane protein TolC
LLNRHLVLLAGMMAAASGVQAQQLSLDEALQRADRAAYGNRIADGHARAQAGEADRALQGVLPSFRIEAGLARTTDPIGTFGMTLRQRSITAADFDPALLNYPAARRDYGAAVVLEQPLLNLDAWVGRRAAAHATAAVREQAAWTRGGTDVDVVRAYYGAVLVVERVATLEAASRTAAAHVGRAASLAREGMVTRADELLASVHAGEIEAQLVEARGDASLAKRRLAVLLGSPSDTSFILPSALPSAAVLKLLDARAWQPSIGTRADVRAARAGEAAARADARRARSTLLPRVNAMARYDWHSADSPFGGDENWSIGIMASWTPVGSANQLADVRATAGRAAAAEARAEAALAAAELEAAAAANAWMVAIERLRIASEAVEQSAEAHRIVARRYDGGLSTVAELLGAATAETESRLRHSHARYDATTAAAERLQRSGHDAAELAALLDETNARTEDDR